MFLFWVVFLIDGISKFLTDRYLPLISSASSKYPYGGIGVFSDFFGIEFSIVHATNTGAAWGIFSAYPKALLAFRIAVILGLIYFYFSKASIGLKIPLSLILAGALGNILDIFIYGHVVDMFHFNFWGYRYPVFNVADSAICIGVALYLIFSWVKPHDSSRQVR